MPVKKTGFRVRVEVLTWVSVFLCCVVLLEILIMRSLNESLRTTMKNLVKDEIVGVKEETSVNQNELSILTAEIKIVKDDVQSIRDDIQSVKKTIEKNKNHTHLYSTGLPKD